ncbi:hypothetical protein ACIOJE_38340 [Kitasatospora sp. NPDC087861]|uniref:hypothetical protein n=1 Tax=unclassified Kitasatospora TaxID=2633591 RepID=UPI0024738077|nr:hypothetical protein [Kitasatospora sp. MAA19]
MIPDPPDHELDLSGDLSNEEMAEKQTCERAFAHADRAAWMKGKAMQVYRNKKYHQRYYGLTWAEYCEEHLGLSESDANRQIQQWPLAAAIESGWTSSKIPPASHVQTLLPASQAYGLEKTVEFYTQLRAYAQERSIRVTAEVIRNIVTKVVNAADGPLPVAVFHAQAKAIEPPRREASAPRKHSARPASPESPGSPPDATEADHRRADQDIVDAEIVEDQALAVLAQLTDVRDGLETKLAGAPADVLTAIANTADAIADAADDARKAEAV